jgi:hypothetical protein
MGPAPLFLVDANIRGAGKGLLVQVIGQIVDGREMPASSYADDPDEMRKQITAIAMAGDRLVHFDNIDGKFGNAAIDRAITSTRWKDRILGCSQTANLPLLATWFATGNNVLVAADTARRIMHVRLDVLHEHPEERANFKHPDLLAWVRSQRGKLVAAGLTILAGYIRAGSPDQRLTPFGSFEGWSKLVRSSIVWAGLPDPCETRAALAVSSDSTTDILADLIAAFQLYDPGRRGVIIAETLDTLYRPEYQPSDPASLAMRNAIESLCGTRVGSHPSAKSVGYRLRGYRRRVSGDLFLDAERKKSGMCWILKSVADEAGSAHHSTTTP